MALSHSPSIVTDGLVLCLDAANLKSYPRSGTVWRDLGFTSTNGTLTNGPTFSQSNGGFIVFDGVDDFINCGTGLALSASWSIGAFINCSISSAVQVFLARTGDVSTSFIQNYAIYVGSDNLFACQSSANSYRRVQSTTSMLTNHWYYIVGTYNVTSKIISIYVNGNLENQSTPLTVDPPTTSTQYLTLAANDGLSISNRLTGNIAFAQIYNKNLSSEEIKQNFNALRGRFGI